jgi:hypothetical protein
MTDLFSSSKLMMCRARHHIGDLANQINAFMDGKPWTHLVENNVDGTKNLHKIKFTKRLPEDTSCMVFDAANNIRSVLDQMAFAIAVKHTGIIKPKSAKFPFGPTEFDMLNNSKGACKDLPPEISSLFESFRPYKGGNNLLWALNELANTPKHETIVPVGIGGATTSFLPPGIIRGELVIQPPSWDPINKRSYF